ncbi:MAG TPA: hypothetical protein PKJ39_02415 [Caldisericia bacterium]|nr:hypothetical protein [Caldisericia bacterium]HQO99608.1 hypothetical protein [Caldisericia bacterium]
MKIKKSNKLKIALIYRQKPVDYDIDKYYIFDDKDTIDCIIKTLKEIADEVIDIDANKSKDIYEDINKLKGKVDIVFNIANNGVNDQIGTLINIFVDYLSIPYIGSNAETLNDVSDKSKTKIILNYYGIEIAPFQVFSSYLQKLNRKLNFPLIVKPIYGGSSFGITQESVVYSYKDLVKQIKKVIKSYKQPALVEEYLEGIEYTIGVIGNKKLFVFPVISFDLNKLDGKPKVRDYHVKLIDKECSKILEYTKDTRKFYNKISNISVKAFIILKCNDLARMEIREKDGGLYFIEINAKPGLDPNHSDLPSMAKCAGIEYKELIAIIIYEALKRYNLEPNDKIYDIIENVNKKINFIKVGKLSNSKNYYLLKNLT